MNMIFRLNLPFFLRLATPVGAATVLTISVAVAQVSAQIPPPSPTSPPSSADTFEITHRGHTVRTELDKATAKVTIHHNGKPVAILDKVGAMKAPKVVEGLRVSLVRFWINTPAADCAAHVLVGLPAPGEASAVTVKTGFGACNSMLVETSLKRRNWQFWGLVAYRNSARDAEVAVERDGQIRVSTHPALPCLFDRNSAARDECSETYMAMGLGSAERGIPSSRETVAGRTYTTWLNRAAKTARLERDGEALQTLDGVRVFHIENIASTGSATLLSIATRPAEGPCGARTIILVPQLNGPIETHADVGKCLDRSVTRTKHRADQSLDYWLKLMWRDREPDAAIVYWHAGKISIETVRADACLAAPQPPSDCLVRHVPRKLEPLNTSVVASTPPVAAPVPAAAPPTIPVDNAGGGPLVRGLAAMAKRDLDSAIAEFDRAIMGDVSNARAYMLRGYALALKGRADNALTDLDRAIEMAPSVAEAYAYRGFAYLKRFEAERAIAQLDHALTLAPRDALALTFRGQAYAMKRDTDRAIAEWTAALTIDPRQEMALRGRGHAFASKGDHEGAIGDFRAALAVVGRALDAEVGLARSLEAMGRNDEAIAAYATAEGFAARNLVERAVVEDARRRREALVAGAAPKPGCGKGVRDCL